MNRCGQMSKWEDVRVLVSHRAIYSPAKKFSNCKADTVYFSGNIKWCKCQWDILTNQRCCPSFALIRCLDTIQVALLLQRVLPQIQSVSFNNSTLDKYHFLRLTLMSSRPASATHCFVSSTMVSTARITVVLFIPSLCKLSDRK